MFDSLFKFVNSLMISPTSINFNDITDIASDPSSNIIPAPQNFNNFLLDTYRSHGALWETINIFGIRNEQGIKDDIWNDIIGIEYGGKIDLGIGTADPSVFWTNNPMNPKGCAHLVFGYHNRIWRKKKHKGQYRALCNDWQCNRQKVWRDVDKDFKHTSKDIIDIGWFGCNLHAANWYQLVEVIGKYSAGCQVILDIEFFKHLMEIVYASQQDRFSYFLFDWNQIPKNILDYINKNLWKKSK